MSITLTQIMDAVNTAAPTESTEVKAQMIARIIKSMDAETKAMATPMQAKPKAKAPQKATAKQEWQSGKPSASQIKRIVRCEEALIEAGLAAGAVLRKSQRSVALRTAGSASLYYKSLATITRQHALQF